MENKNISAAVGAVVAMTGQLRVTPEQLKIKATETTAEINQMSQAFDELARVVARTSHYWIGEAGNSHRQEYEKEKKEIDEMLRRLKEHPADLLKMANVYETTEDKVEALAADLPDDVIS